MSVLALAALMVAQLQAAPTAAELVDAILDHVGYPERLAESPIHLDIEAIRQAFGDSVVQDAPMRLEDLAVRHREDDRLRVGRKEEVVRCVEVDGRFPDCTVGDGDEIFVSVTEAGPSSEPGPSAEAGEIRVADFTHLGEDWQAIDTPGSIEFLPLAGAALLAADADDVIRGYDIELFLGKDPENEAAWRVVDTGVAIVS